MPIEFVPVIRKHTYRFLLITLVLSSLSSLEAEDGIPAADAKPVGYEPSRFEITPLATGLLRPMELAVAPDGTIFFIELDGKLKRVVPKTGNVELVGELVVTTEQENGLIGLALDPQFATNGWVYLQYSPPDFTGQHISRFELKDGKLDLASEKLLLKYQEQRRECCHHAGSMAFGPDGCLIIGTGDNTHPHGDSEGFAPLDERTDRSPWDAQKSSANSRSFNGKILRIKPKADGTYEIPDGNLFPKDGSQGQPEIYAMGCRNPWRISVDQKTGYVYWGDVGPDAGGDGPRGPRGYDELNQARKAGNFGWPYFIADNQAYADYDFESRSVGPKYDVKGPKNLSPNNTGSVDLPPPQPAFIYYPYGKSSEFPVLGEGGRTACAGPAYDFDSQLKSDTKFPEAFDRTLFFFEWSRNWIMAVHLTADSNIERIEPFLPERRFVRPIDMEFGPEGSLYVIEYGETWGVNKDAQIIRIDYVRGNRAPVARASASNNIGREPLAVVLSSEGTSDKDNEPLEYTWTLTKSPPAIANEEPLKEPVTVTTVRAADGNATLTIAEPGIYNAVLTVRDAGGLQSSASVPVLVGNDRPEVSFVRPTEGDFYFPNQQVDYQLVVSDREDGTTDPDHAVAANLDEIDADAALRVSLNANFAPGLYSVNRSADQADGPPGFLRMKRSDCFNCHAVDQPRVGPQLIDVAKKYRNQDGALAASVDRVLKGSTGVWGKVPMIPHAGLERAEAEEMVQWIYSLQEIGSVKVLRGLTGNLSISQEEFDRAAVLSLEGNYSDLGHGDLPPLVGAGSIRLRHPRVEAEGADEIHGSSILDSGTAHNGKFIGAIDDGHYLVLKQISLQKIRSAALRVTSAGAGGVIEIHLDQVDGPLLAQCQVEVNGSWDAWHDKLVSIESQPDRHDLFIVFKNPTNRGGLMNLDSILFRQEPLEPSNDPK